MESCMSCVPAGINETLPVAGAHKKNRPFGAVSETYAGNMLRAIRNRRIAV